MDALDFIRAHALTLPLLVKFALGMVTIFGVSALSRRLGIPPVVGLLFSGVVLGPHVLDMFGEKRPIADFLADLGKLLLMFFAGLEIDLALFRRAQRKAITFGVITTTLPLLLGTAVGVLFGYGMVTAEARAATLRTREIAAVPAQEDADVHFVFLALVPPEESSHALELAAAVDHECAFGVAQIRPRHVEPDVAARRALE